MSRRAMSRCLSLAVLLPVAALALAPAEASAQEGARAAAELRDSYACTIVGGTAAGIALVAGTQPVLGAIGTGVGAVVAPAAVAVGIAGVAFATFCIVGMEVAPAAIDLSARLAAPVMEAGRQGAQLLDQAGAALSPVAEAATTHVVEPVGRFGRQGAEAVTRACQSTGPCDWLLRQFAPGTPAAVATAAVTPR